LKPTLRMSAWVLDLHNSSWMTVIPGRRLNVWGTYPAFRTPYT
jgi:hypothetical protein